MEHVRRVSHDRDDVTVVLGLLVETPAAVTLWRWLGCEGSSAMLWAVLLVILILWLLGFIGSVGGSLIHLLLVVALVVLIVQLATGRAGD